MRKPAFAYAKTKTQISCAITAQLISAFVFATRIVKSLYFLNPKFQASSHLLWLHSPVCLGLGQKPRRPVFTQRSSYLSLNWRHGVHFIFMFDDCIFRSYVLYSFANCSSNLHRKTSKNFARHFQVRFFSECVVL